jgi:hypothetical protein
VLIDNARALVEHHDTTTREVTFNARFHAFARYWGFKPRACAPYRARTKGKDERGVGYVKRNAIAGRRFASWAELEAHLGWWMREVADRRVHGTTGELPIERFCRNEVKALQAIDGRPPFRQVRVVTRRVQGDGCIDLDTNHYQRALAADWRPGDGGGERRDGAHLSRRIRGRLSPGTPGPARARRRHRPSRRHRRRSGHAGRRLRLVSASARRSRCQ